LWYCYPVSAQHIPPAAVVALATLSGCSVVGSMRLADGSIAQRGECSDHQAKLRLLANLAEWEALSVPDVRRRAEQIVSSAGARTALDQIAALHRYVRDRVTFTVEPVETFTSTMRTLEHGLGDCDDSARALLALLRSLGHNAGLMVLPDPSSGKPPEHVAAAVRIDGRWHWLETSIAAEPGEHPLDAAARLGITARPELRA
jgi:transglutaminase-like putative cysteine protease